MLRQIHQASLHCIAASRLRPPGWWRNGSFGSRKWLTREVFFISAWSRKPPATASRGDARRGVAAARETLPWPGQLSDTILVQRVGWAGSDGGGEFSQSGDVPVAAIRTDGMGGPLGEGGSMSPLTVLSRPHRGRAPVSSAHGAGRRAGDPLGATGDMQPLLRPAVHAWSCGRWTA